MSKYKGEIKNFPKEVVEWMLKQQTKQRNKRNIKVFEKNKTASKKNKGFDWDLVKGGYEFSSQVIAYENFDYFYQMYPKKK